MKTFIWSIALFSALIGIILISEVCYGRVTEGKEAPVFSLKDLDGKNHDLSGMKTRPLVIIYFFDVESRPSQEGLLKLDVLVKKYHSTEFTVLAVTRSSGKKGH